MKTSKILYKHTFPSGLKAGCFFIFKDKTFYEKQAKALEARYDQMMAARNQ